MAYLCVYIVQRRGLWLYLKHREKTLEERIEIGSWLSLPKLSAENLGAQEGKYAQEEEE